LIVWFRQSVVLSMEFRQSYATHRTAVGALPPRHAPGPRVRVPGTRACSITTVPYSHEPAPDGDCRIAAQRQPRTSRSSRSWWIGSRTRVPVRVRGSSKPFAASNMIVADHGPA
jgi:hypothetical protein